jgi:hypothetical protein
MIDAATGAAVAGALATSAALADLTNDIEEAFLTASFRTGA